MELNFYASVKPLVIFLGVLGLVPFHFKNHKVCTAHFNSVYIGLLISIHLILSYEAISVQHKVIQKTALSFETISRTVYVTCVMAIFINTISRRKQFLQLLLGMIKCQNYFKEITHIHYKKIRRQMYIYAAILISVLTTNIVIQICFIPEAFNFKLSIYFTTFGFPMLINDGICFLAILHILEFKNGFCVLNKGLKHMRTRKRSKWFKYETVLKNPNVENLATIGSLHQELNKCIKKFNDIFGVLLVAMLIMSFVRTLTGLYFAYVNYLYSRYAPVFCCTMMVFSYTGNFTLLCQNCSATVDEVIACFTFDNHICCVDVGIFIFPAKAKIMTQIG